MKRAFTLIELLVVIAIIAILAAILFPVFAQAKAAAKKTADLSNNKQLGTSIAIYLSDSDDLYPQATGQSPTTGQWGYNYNKYVPNDWAASPGNPDRPYYSSTFFMNSIQPYAKNYDILMPAGSQVVEYNAAEAVAAGKKKQSTSYAYNGYLQSYPSTSVAQPAMLPVLTGANGNIAGKGWGFANPMMSCDDAKSACVYVPGTPIANSAFQTCGTGNGSSGGMYLTYNGGSYWTFSKGQNWAFSDGHAKFHTQVAVTPSTVTHISATDPWVKSDEAGHSTSYFYDGCHAFLYRPEYDFSFQNL